MRYAYLLGTEQLVMPRLAEVASTSWCFPTLTSPASVNFTSGLLGKEEERFADVRNGLTSSSKLVGGPEALSCSTAFALPHSGCPWS